MGGGEQERPRLVLEIPVERVESEVTADGTFRAKLAIETLPHLPPVISEVRVPAGVIEMLDGTPEGRAEAIAELCLETVQRDVLAAAGAYVKAHAGVNVLGTEPRIPHADRARLLAELIEKRADVMRRDGGAHWLCTMIEAEFRAVYADGERKGGEASAPRKA